MKVRNIVRKAAQIGAGMGLVGTTLVGALAYDLADYPAQFIESGAFDGVIVVGERAATADVIGSIDIAASLQASSTTQEEVEIPGQAGEVTLEGDAFKVERSNDLLEVRETVGEVYDTLTESELEALGGGEITTDQGSTDYNQFLRFGTDGNADGLQEMAVNYVEDTDRNILGDFLVIDDSSGNTGFFEWELEFTEGLESEIDGTELDDLEDEQFNIFGTMFTFVDSELDTSDNNGLVIEFMAGQVSDTLREGETRTYSIDGVDYEVTLVFVSDPNNAQVEVKFSVNGELTDAMEDGDTDTLSGGLQLGVRDILVNAREGVASFFLGANKVEFDDPTTNTESFDGTAEINNENIQDGVVAIQGGSAGSGKWEITSIKYRVTAESLDGGTIYVPAGHGVREFMDEPEGLLSPTFDIRYEGLKDVRTHPVQISAGGGDDDYVAVATNLRGTEYRWPLLTNEDGTFKWGDDDDDFWFTEPSLNFTGTDGTVAGGLNNTGTGAFWIGDEDFFLVSENPVGSATDKDDSAVFQYKQIDTSDRQITFRNLGTGDQPEETYTLDTTNTLVLGMGDIVIEGTSYDFWIGNTTGFPIAFDLDNDGNLSTGSQVGFTVRGGATLNFDEAGTAQIYTTSTAQTGSIVQSLKQLASEFDNPTTGDELNWTVINRTDDEVGLTSVNYDGPLSGSDEWDQFAFEDDPGNSDVERGMTDFGALIELDDPSGSDEAESLTVYFPEVQVGAQVFVVAGTVEAGTSGGLTRDVVNPIAVGLAVLDTDAPALGEENLIIVGGPCANTVAAAFLGNPANCAEGFEPGKAMISAQEYGSTVAILVAGYEAQETLGASRVLAQYEDYNLEGMEVEVVVADLNSITVQAPSNMDDSMDDDMDDMNETA